MDRQKRSRDASWVTSLRQTGPVGRGRLELELLWAFTSGTRTKLASGLLLDLDTLTGLLTLHTMCQTWSYAWVSCPHHVVWNVMQMDCQNSAPGIDKPRRMRLIKGFPTEQLDLKIQRKGWSENLERKS